MKKHLILPVLFINDYIKACYRKTIVNGTDIGDAVLKMTLVLS